MAEWSLNIDDWVKDAKKKTKAVKRKFAFACYAEIAKRTPVDTGRARANWNVSVGKPDYSTDEEKTCKDGEPLPHKESEFEADGDESIYITNNLPYIKTLEFGGYPEEVKKGTWVKGKSRGKGKRGPGHYEIRSRGGYSKQAPQGMVGITLASAEKILNAVLRTE